MNLNYKTCSLFFLICIGFNCTQSKNCEPVVDPSKILNNMMSWLVYKMNYLDKDVNYSVIDENCDSIEKTLFFQKIIKGDYLPLKVKASNRTNLYKLYRIRKPTDSEVLTEIRRNAENALKFYEMEGDKIPFFSFTDIHGNIFNNVNTKGKVIVVNCWFINCNPCVKEMPDLNLLLEQFKGRTDIEFIALAFDSKTDIKQFLKKHEFKYNIIPDMEEYLLKDLRISGYPTHIIVGKNGKIFKVLESSQTKFLKEVIEDALVAQL